MGHTPPMLLRLGGTGLQSQEAWVLLRALASTCTGHSPASLGFLTEIDTFPAPPSFQVMEGWLEIPTQTVSLHPVVGPLVIHLFAK